MNFRVLSLLLPIIGASCVNVAYAMENEEESHVTPKKSFQEQLEDLQHAHEQQVASLRQAHERQRQAYEKLDQTVNNLTEACTEFKEKLEDPTFAQKLREQLNQDPDKTAEMFKQLDDAFQTL